MKLRNVQILISVFILITFLMFLILVYSDTQGNAKRVKYLVAAVSNLNSRVALINSNIDDSQSTLDELRSKIGYLETTLSDIESDVSYIRRWMK